MATSLKDVLQKKKEYAERTERPQFDYFSLKDNNPAKVVFLQEIDPDVKTEANEKGRGSALFLVEHTSPHDFRRRAECTFEEEGRCFACEMNQEEPENKWWAKTNFYIQVFNAKDNKVKVLSRPVANKEGGFFDLLYTWAEEENEGSITDQTFSISKAGEKTSPWTLMPTTKKLEVPDTVELVDLEQAVGIKIEYEKQRNFYIPRGFDSDSAESKGDNPKPKEADLDW